MIGAAAAIASLKSGAQISAKDDWSNSSDVSIRRFATSKDLSQDGAANLSAALAAIQQDRPPLFPRLIDFYLGKNSVFLVLEPSMSCPDSFLNSDKSLHSLAISLCDLHLFCFSLTPPLVPPAFEICDFEISKLDTEIVIPCLFPHLLDTYTRKVKDRVPGEELTALCAVLKNLNGQSTFESFADAMTQSENLLLCKKSNRSDADAKQTLQKVRAVFKKHEERIRKDRAARTGAV